MPAYKIIAISRIKDSLLTGSEFFYRLSQLVDGVIVVDNGSTDGTEKIYEYFSDSILEIHKTEGFDEGRDRRLCLELVRKYNPEWILYLDSDELIEYGVTRGELLQLMANPRFDMYILRLFHFWNSKTHHRFDGKFIPYTLNYQPRLCRNLQEVFFGNEKIHSGFFQGVSKRRTRSTSIRILHYGYIYEEQIKKKHNLYTTIDRTSGRTYEHIMQDDIRLRPFLASSSGWRNYIIRCWVKLWYDAHLKMLALGGHLRSSKADK